MVVYSQEWESDEESQSALKTVHLKFTKCRNLTLKNLINDENATSVDSMYVLN